MSLPLRETETLLADLIAFPTVSHLPNMELIHWLAGMLEQAGARVDLYEDDTGTKANLWATLGPDTPGGLVLSGHTDVVPITDQDWTRPPFTLTEEDDHLFGRGTCDMKGFIAAATTMAARFGEVPLHRPVHFCFTHDEEIGCMGAQALLPQLQARGVQPAMAIIGEPTGMKVIEGHKGCCEYSVHFTGLEGHGSAPDHGVNAVEYAVRYVSRLLELSQDLRARAPEGSRFDPPWTTINIGALTGGSAHNVIPGKARLDWEMRPVRWDDADFVKTAVADLVAQTLLPDMRRVSPTADIITETLGEVVGLEPMPENAARDLVMSLTGANTCDVVPFGTEAGLFQSMGMDVIVCGPGHIAQAHKPDEYLSRGQLVQCLDMLDRLGTRLAD